MVRALFAVAKVSQLKTLLLLWPTEAQLLIPFLPASGGGGRVIAISGLTFFREHCRGKSCFIVAVNIIPVFFFVCINAASVIIQAKAVKLLIPSYPSGWGLFWLTMMPCLTSSVVDPDPHGSVFV